jgi:hypothetical protein
MRSNVVSRNAWQLIIAGAALATVGACTAEEPVPAKATWVDVEPILRGNCFHCHGGGGRPTNDAASPTGAIRFDVFDPTEAAMATGGTFVDAAAARAHVMIFVGPDGPPSKDNPKGIPNVFGRNYMPPPPGNSLSDRDFKTLKSWVNNGFAKGEKKDNHLPTIEWLNKPNSVLVSDEDLDQVLGTLTCGGTTINLVRSGGWPLGGLAPPCTAKLYDGWQLNTVQLAP